MTTNGLHIQVGRSLDAQTIHIPKSVIDSCPALKDFLVPGCRIVNADPAVFTIIIEHMQSIVSFGLISFSAPGHLHELTLSNVPLLNFAKAWHIGDMLRMPDLQNNIIKVYSTHYTKCLDDDLNLSLPPGPIDPQPFAYLRDNIGFHTKAERFLIDFYAGLVKDHPKLKRDDYKFLSTDIALLIKDRWKQLRGRRDSTQATLSNDRIIARDRCFKANTNEMVIHSSLQVQYLYAGAGTSFGFNPPVRVDETRRKASRASNSSVSHSGTRLEGSKSRKGRGCDVRSGSMSRARLSRTGVAEPQETTVEPQFTTPFREAAARPRELVPSPSVSPATVPFEQ